MRKFLSLILVFAIGYVLPMSAEETRRGNTYILAVGVADYPGTVNDLHFCDADARSISNVFVSKSKASVTLLTNSQATVANILNSMEQLFMKAASNDVIIFFFSGHGLQGGFCAYDKLLYYNQVYSIMKRSKAKTKCIMADACYAGKARTNTSQHVRSAKNIMLFLSSRTSETSLEIGQMRHGLFAYYLEKALCGAADANRDRYIIAVELFNYVSKNVSIYAKRNHNHQQHPVMWGNFPKNMVVVKY